MTRALIKVIGIQVHHIKTPRRRIPPNLFFPFPPILEPIRSFLETRSPYPGTMLVHHALAVLPFVALAFSGPLIGRNPQVCNTGTIQCCQSVQSVRRFLSLPLS